MKQKPEKSSPSTGQRWKRSNWTFDIIWKNPLLIQEEKFHPQKVYQKIKLYMKKIKKLKRAKGDKLGDLQLEV